MAETNLGVMSTIADPALQAASWDLEPLVESRGVAGVEELLIEARDRSTAFAERHRGRVAELDSAGLVDAMNELASIHDLAGRAGSYAMLWFTLDTADPPRGALIQKARELGAAIETQLLFFELDGTSSTRSAPSRCWGRRSSTSAATSCAPCAATARTS